MKYFQTIAMVLPLGLVAMGSAFAAHHEESGSASEEITARAFLQNAEQERVGVVHLKEAPHGVLLNVSLENVPAGQHGFHVHAVGQCTPPDFKSAGGHFNPLEDKHGIMAEEGAHIGDLPNIHVPQSGALDFEVLVSGATLETGVETSLMDEDGSAIMIHSGPDDYMSDPAGDAGSRIACGVVELP